MKKVWVFARGLLFLSLMSFLHLNCKKDKSPVEPPSVEQSFSIVARVIDAATGQNDEPLAVPGATVFFNDLAITQTNDAGYFEIYSAGLNAGDVELKIRKAGYLDFIGTFNTTDIDRIDFTFPLVKPKPEITIKENSVYQVDDKLLIVPEGAVNGTAGVQVSPIPGQDLNNADAAPFLELDLLPEGLAFNTPLIFKMPVPFLSGFTDTVFIFSEKYNVMTSQWMDEGEKGFGVNDTISIFLDQFSRHRYRTKPSILAVWSWDGDPTLQSSHTFEIVGEMCAGPNGHIEKVEKSLSKSVNCSSEFMTPFVKKEISPLNVKLAWKVEIPACKCCTVLYRYQVKKYQRKIRWAAYRAGESRPSEPYANTATVYYKDGFKALEAQLINVTKNTRDPACHDQGGGGS